MIIFDGFFGVTFSQFFQSYMFIASTIFVNTRLLQSLVSTRLSHFHIFILHRFTLILIASVKEHNTSLLWRRCRIFAKCIFPTKNWFSKHMIFNMHITESAVQFLCTYLDCKCFLRTFIACSVMRSGSSFSALWR